MKFAFLFLLFFSFPVLSAQETSAASSNGSSDSNQFDSSGFDSYVQQAVKDWDVPGMAVAVIKGDSVLFQKGYGVRELGKNDPVDTETLFAIASTTKAFTAAALGMLVDEGLMGWEDPVVKHLPDFRLRDAYLTQLITVRDLLTHRAGLPNTDFLWLDPTASTGEILDRLEHVEVGYPLRSGFIYQNVMYAVAGEVIEAVSGIPWDEFIRTRILQPLQMQRTSPTQSGIRSRKNVATPHDYAAGKLLVVENSQADAIGPAGSMWSSAADMSRWMRFLLRGCETEAGEKLLQQGTCEELFRPQVVLPEPSYPTAELTDPNWHTYGLGWFQQDYEGRKVDFHTGSLSGMVAIAGLIRDEGVGIYVLGNRDHAELRHALMYRVFDLFDDQPPRDWSRDIKALYDRREEEQRTAREKAEAERISERVADTEPSLPPASYVGTYQHPLYGTVEITKPGQELRLKYGGTTGNLEHWHYDTFRLNIDRPEIESRPMVSFDLGPSGKVQRVRLSGAEFERE